MLIYLSLHSDTPYLMVRNIDLMETENHLVIISGSFPIFHKQENAIWTRSSNDSHNFQLLITIFEKEIPKINVMS